ncbi:MAG: DUF2326 domain-containing protein [Candidatus Bathyarchaeota archaeon]|nr:DUF2326 domain-containing protein [Candidatus Termiticorpusculum sp.]
MIYTISSNHSTFKTIDFTTGFNVILADRTKEATKQDSRNGLGKSTLIEVIHFCLGSDKGETLKKSQLDDWSFTLKLDLAGKVYSVTRNTNSSSRLIIDGDYSTWPIKPKFDNKTGKNIISNNDWKKVLGELMFGIPVIGESKYHPTFRSLISYFARKNGQSGGFLNPFQQCKEQKTWDIQVNNAYLLGLGWDFGSKWQVLKDRTKVLNQLKQEAASGLMPAMGGSIGDLEAHKIRLVDQVEQERVQLDNFKVHPQYSQLEEKANSITVNIHELMNENISDKRLVEYYEGSIKEERIDNDSKKITQLYEEAGLVLPDLVTKQLSEVLEFHKNIIINRKSFLQLEIDKLKQNIVRREKEKTVLTSERAELLETLKVYGALDEWTRLQNIHQTNVAKLKDVSLKLENLKAFVQGKSAVTVEQELLFQQAETDLNERKFQKETAILTFNSYSKELYATSGNLSIDIEKTGYKFNVSIERAGSHGIENMKIFCYDLMLAKLWATKRVNQMFLIHDSILFADVDERQKALALELAAAESKKSGFQYICMMNSDYVPREDFRSSFDFGKYVRKTFTDATDDGGLLGQRF